MLHQKTEYRLCFLVKYNYLINMCNFSYLHPQLLELLELLQSHTLSQTL